MAFNNAHLIEQLWQAAHSYEFKEISGSAHGLVTLGIIANKPKCMEVAAWQKSIWSLYYTRKAELVANPNKKNVDLDFSPCGPIPHTIPELMEEVYPSS